MIESSGNIFKVKCDAVCITTNGFVKRNGENVMGRGCAYEAAKLIPELPYLLGSKIKSHGNHVHQLYSKNGVVFCSFPVKPSEIEYSEPEQVVRYRRRHYSIGQVVPGWACAADLDIIKRSACELVDLTDDLNWNHVVLPRPGCGAGERSWEQVGTLLQSILDDRFTCMTF